MNCNDFVLLCSVLDLASLLQLRASILSRSRSVAAPAAADLSALKKFDIEAASAQEAHKVDFYV